MNGWGMLSVAVWMAVSAPECRSHDQKDPRKSSAAAGAAKSNGTLADRSRAVLPSTEKAKPLRLMFVGDSITAGPGCFKKHLVARLREAQISGFEFVGQYTDDCGGGVRHSAVSCATTEDFLAEMFRLPACFGEREFPGLTRLLKVHQPELLLVQLGVNDIWRGASHSAVLERYGRLVEQSRRVLPRLGFVFAQVPRFEPDCRRRDLSDEAARLIAQVPAWAAAQERPESSVDSVDLWSKSSADLSVTTDCVHPNEEGERRLGELWFQELRPILARFLAASGSPDPR